MAPRLSSLRHEAARAALDEMMRTHGGNRSEIARRLGGVRQQQISKALLQGSIGEQLADSLAKYYGTTLDGLVRQFVTKEGAVRAGDLIGWSDALTEARRRHPKSFEAWAWHRAADLRLPVAPAMATPELVFDIAALLHKHAEVSAIIERQISEK